MHDVCRKTVAVGQCDDGHLSARKFPTNVIFNDTQNAARRGKTHLSSNTGACEFV